MTSKYEGHTPGPWKAQDKYSTWAINGASLNTGFEGSVTPLVCEIKRRAVTDAQTAANARLVADAPTLLKQRDALREAMSSARAFISTLPEDAMGFHHEPDGSGWAYRDEMLDRFNKALALCDETEAVPASIQQQKGGE